MKTFKVVLFWIISCTWGILMTLFGAIGTLFLMITGHKPQLFHHFIYVKVGKDWGGLEAGPFFFTDDSPNLHIKQHEAGHGYQNIILGPLMPFIVTLPSALRYWIREFKSAKSKYLFVFIVYAILLVITATLSLLSFSLFKVLWLTILCDCIAAYGLIIFCWAIFKEIPKYADGSTCYSVNGDYIDYDDIHFERGATTIGEIKFPSNSLPAQDISLKDILKNL